MLGAYASASCVSIVPDPMREQMHGRTDGRTHVDAPLKAIDISLAVDVRGADDFAARVEVSDPPRKDSGLMKDLLQESQLIAKHQGTGQLRVIKGESA